VYFTMYNDKRSARMKQLTEPSEKCLNLKLWTNKQHAKINYM